MLPTVVAPEQSALLQIERIPWTRIRPAGSVEFEVRKRRTWAIASPTCEPGVGVPTLKKPPMMRARASPTEPLVGHGADSIASTVTRALIAVMAGWFWKSSDQLVANRPTSEKGRLQVRCISSRLPFLMVRMRSPSCQRRGLIGLSVKRS